MRELDAATVAAMVVARRGRAAVSVFGPALALLVGIVLGLLGGGGSLLAVPIFLYVFHVPPKPAIAMSLVVVGMSALVGFLTHWRQGTVNVRSPRCSARWRWSVRSRARGSRATFRHRCNFRCSPPSR